MKYAWARFLLSEDVTTLQFKIALGAALALLSNFPGLSVLFALPVHWS